MNNILNNLSSQICIIFNSQGTSITVDTFCETCKKQNTIICSTCNLNKICTCDICKQCNQAKCEYCYENNQCKICKKSYCCLSSCQNCKGKVCRQCLKKCENCNNNNNDNNNTNQNICYSCSKCQICYKSRCCLSFCKGCKRKICQQCIKNCENCKYGNSTNQNVCYLCSICENCHKRKCCLTKFNCCNKNFCVECTKDHMDFNKHCEQFNCKKCNVVISEQVNNQQVNNQQVIKYSKNTIYTFISCVQKLNACEPCKSILCYNCFVDDLKKIKKLNEEIKCRFIFQEKCYQCFINKLVSCQDCSKQYCQCCTNESMHTCKLCNTRFNVPLHCKIDTDFDYDEYEQSNQCLKCISEWSNELVCHNCSDEKQFIKEIECGCGQLYCKTHHQKQVHNAFTLLDCIYCKSMIIEVEKTFSHLSIFPDDLIYIILNYTYNYKYDHYYMEDNNKDDKITTYHLDTLFE